MVHAFVMVKTHVGSSESILESVRGVPEVEEAHIVAGAYDLIVEVDADDVQDVLGAAARGIRTLDGVAETKTYVSFRD